MKKALSMILALTLFVTSLSVSFVAFAAEKEKDVAEFEKLATEFTGNMTVAQPSADDEAGYNAIINAYKKLSEGQKKDVDIAAFNKMLQKIYDREGVLSGQSSSSKKKEYAFNQLEKMLGARPWFLDSSLELYNTLKSSSDADTKKDAFLKADEYSRVYSGHYLGSYKYFYYVDLSKTNVSIDKVITAMASKNPYTGTNPESVWPGYQDDEANKGLSAEEYSKKYRIYVDAYMAQKEFTINANLSALKEIADSATEYKALVKFYELAKAGKEAFDANNSDIKAAGIAMDNYKALSDIGKKYIDNSKTNIVTYETDPTTVGNKWPSTEKTISYYYDACLIATQMQLVVDFSNYINGIEKPYTNETIAQVKDEYNKLPKILQSRVPEDVMTKYKEILASVGPEAPSYDKPDLSKFVKTLITYPDDVKPEQIDKLIVELQKMILDLVNGALGENVTLPEGGVLALAKDSIYTNAMIGTIISAIFPTLGEAVSMLKVGPETVAAQLTEKKYAKANAILNAAKNADDTLAGWQNVSFANGDFGFVDGDREAFLDALVAALRPTSIAFMFIFNMPNEINTEKGTYKFGLYEELIPIFETLGLRGVLSSHEYTLNYQNIVKNDSNMYVDAVVRPILVPIANLIDDLLANPADTLFELLPKVGRLFENDLLDTQVQKFIVKLSAFAPDLKVSLKAGDLFDMIAPMLQNLKINDNLTISITLNKAKFVQLLKDLAGSGDGIAQDSVSASNAYILGVDSDHSDAFMTVYRWLYSEITTKANIKEVKKVVNSLNLAGTDKVIAMMAVELLAALPSDTVLGLVVSAILPKDPADPTPDEPTTNKPTTNEPTTVAPGTVDGATNQGGANGTGNGSNSTSVEGVPSTGDYSIGAFVGLTALAGIALVMTKKKKEF